MIVGIFESFESAKEMKIMSFQFRKSIKIAPGVKLNISKNGVSVTVGNKYVRTTIGKKKTISASIPGTGLTFVKRLKKK